MSKKPTWVELMESSIEEMKKEYDERFKKLETELTKYTIINHIDLLSGVFSLAAIGGTDNFNVFLRNLKAILDEWKDMGIEIFKSRKVLDDVIEFGPRYGVKDFKELIKMLVAKFNVKLIKESVTVEKVTEFYGTEGAKIFKELG